MCGYCVAAYLQPFIEAEGLPDEADLRLAIEIVKKEAVAESSIPFFQHPVVFLHRSIDLRLHASIEVPEGLATSLVASGVLYFDVKTLRAGQYPEIPTRQSI